ncbi:hypothetical protein [Acidovorax sp.]|nr:hypothetical protein [Acidovorax sp.]
MKLIVALSCVGGEMAHCSNTKLCASLNQFKDRHEGTHDDAHARTK